MVSIPEKVWRRADLDAMDPVCPAGCEHGHKEAVLTCKHHQGAPTIVLYKKARGILVVGCCMCRRVVGIIQVAQ